MKTKLIEILRGMITPKKIYLVRRHNSITWKGEPVNNKRLEDLKEKYAVTIVNVIRRNGSMSYDNLYLSNEQA